MIQKKCGRFPSLLQQEKDTPLLIFFCFLCHEIIKSARYILCSFVLCSTSQGKTGGQCSLFLANLITAILGHFNRIIVPYLHCEIDNKVKEQSLNKTPEKFQGTFKELKTLPPCMKYAQ